jgi:endonuclease YncB( thermonuclease family)
VVDRHGSSGNFCWHIHWGWRVVALWTKAFLVPLLLVTQAAAQTVTDGDTLKLNGTTYRLWGIDAPECKQWCNGYPAGVIATGTLEKLIKSKTVVCEPKATDRYGRTVAICRANGEAGAGHGPARHGVGVHALQS